MKHPALVLILLLLYAGTLLALTGLDGSGLRQVPAVPQNLSISRSSDAISLAWDPVCTDSSGLPITNICYHVYCGDFPDFECSDETLIGTVDFSELVLEDADGSPERAFFKVVAVGGEAFMPDNFVYVPAGTFIMGRTTGSSGDYSELPTHSVTLDSFYICSFEVTQSEYTAILGYNPASGSGMGDDYPVYNVSWYAALKYCNLRSMAEGLTPCYTITDSTDPADWGDLPGSGNALWDAAVCDFGANGYRLPTEAEWEYAARAATDDPDHLYSGSDDIDAVAWYWGNSDPGEGRRAHAVGGKAPNALGLHDMSGNVYEWCWDWKGDYSEDAQNNPAGIVDGTHRVLRGGGWNNGNRQCRIAHRGCQLPHYDAVLFGFRICRSGL